MQQGTGHANGIGEHAKLWFLKMSWGSLKLLIHGVLSVYKSLKQIMILELRRIGNGKGYLGTR